MPPDAVGRRDSGLKFDAGSVVRAGVILMCLVAALLLALWLFSVTRHFLFLILLAWLFAAALEPGIRAVMAHGPTRGVAAFATGAGALVLSFLLAALFGRLFFDQISSLVLSIPGTASSVVQWLNDRLGMNIDANTMTSSLSLTPSNIQSWAGALSGGVVSAVGSLTSVVFDLVTVLVFGFYFAGDGPTFFRAIASGMSPRRQRIFVTVTEITTAKTGDYVVSKIILAGLSSLFHGIFFVVIGVPYWLPFALLVGISAQFIPMIGTYIGIVLPVLAVVFVSPWKGVAIVAFAAVYQQIENYVFTPRVSAKTMNVNPAVALAAVFVGVAIWGPLGALIGIPLAAAGVAILETYRKSYDLVPEAAAHARGATPNAGPPG
jgi:predicted PurR-regulated permease PerM